MTIPKQRVWRYCLAGKPTNVAFRNKGKVEENRTLDNDIKYSGETGGFDLLFLIKQQGYNIEIMYNPVPEMFEGIGYLKI